VTACNCRTPATAICVGERWQGAETRTASSPYPRHTSPCIPTGYIGAQSTGWMSGGAQAPAQAVVREIVLGELIKDADADRRCEHATAPSVASHTVSRTTRQRIAAERRPAAARLRSAAPDGARLFLTQPEPPRSSLFLSYESVLHSVIRTGESVILLGSDALGTDNSSG